MITLIHGDDISSSRKYYKSMQKSSSEVLDGEKLTKEILEESLLSTGLFGDEKQIVVENFFSKRKASKEMTEIISVFQSFGKNSDILLWESKEIPKKTFAQLPFATVQVCSIPKSLFVFLESIAPHNTTRMLTLYHQTLISTDAEMVLVMLIRQIRILLAMVENSGAETIEEITRMQPWQAKKLTSQASRFSKEKLIALHTKLYELEVGSKTGGLSLPLSESIDFFLLSI